MDDRSDRKARLRKVRDELLKRIRSITKEQLQRVLDGKIADFVEGLGEKERHYDELAHVLEELGPTMEVESGSGEGIARTDIGASEMIEEVRRLEEDIQRELTARLERVQQEIAGIQSGRKALRAYKTGTAKAGESVCRRG